MHNKLKYKGRFFVILMLVFILLATPITDLSVIGSERLSIDQATDADWETFEGEDIDEIFEYLFMDFSDEEIYQETDELLNEEITSNAPFACRENVCYWTSNMHEHEEYVIAVNRDDDYNYIIIYQ